MKIQKLFQRKRSPLQRFLQQLKQGNISPNRRQKNLAMGSLIGGLLSTAIVALIVPSLRKKQNKKGMLSHVQSQFKSGLSQLKQHLPQQTHEQEELYTPSNGHRIRTMGEV